MPIAGGSTAPKVQVGIIIGSDSDLPTMKAAAQVGGCGCGHWAPVTVAWYPMLCCTGHTPQPGSYQHTAPQPQPTRCPRPLRRAGGDPAGGSAALSRSTPAHPVCAQRLLLLQVLEEFGVGCEVSVVSAHRTPERMFEYAKSAHKRGIKVIIAGAGGAAHLPGLVAAMTPLPVVRATLLARFGAAR
jgi:hypothetical protein